MDTRYTTTQQVVKLIGSHTISKVTVKIGDLKRTKMVRTINLYYNNRTVQAIVELKNKYVSSKSCMFSPPHCHFLTVSNNDALREQSLATIRLAFYYLFTGLLVGTKQRKFS